MSVREEERNRLKRLTFIIFARVRLRAESGKEPEAPWFLFFFLNRKEKKSNLVVFSLYEIFLSEGIFNYRGSFCLLC